MYDIVLELHSFQFPIFRSHTVELLQKKALRVIFSKSPIAHTEPLLKKVSQPKLSDLHVYLINLLKLYYKLYRNRLQTYFDCFLPEYGNTYALNLIVFLLYFYYFKIVFSYMLISYTVLRLYINYYMCNTFNTYKLYFQIMSFSSRSHDP